MLKKLGLYLFSVLFIAVMFGGCAKDDENNVTSSEFNKKGTLTGRLRNAVTGEPISYSTQGENLVKLFLIQDGDTRTPDRLIIDIADPLVGLYVYKNVPFTLYSNSTFPLAVKVPGYQDFYANVIPRALLNTYGQGATTDGGGAITGEFEGFASDSTLLDAVYNAVANIYLFPVGTTAGSVVVTVRDPLGRNVVGAVVQLQPNLTGSVPLAEIGNRLLPAAGLMPVLTATTDSSGVATFAESTLVLGGQYTPYVNKMKNYLGQNLAGTAGAAFIIGPNTENRLITPANLDPAIYVVSASNSVPGSITASGVLTLTFDKAISLNTEVLATQFTAVVADTTAITATVAASLNVAGTVLTLTPTFTPATYSPAPGATITYTHAGAGIVIARDTQAALGNIGGAGGTFAAVTDKFGAAVSSVVLMKTR